MRQLIISKIKLICLIIIIIVFIFKKNSQEKCINQQSQNKQMNGGKKIVQQNHSNSVNTLPYQRAYSVNLEGQRLIYKKENITLNKSIFYLQTSWKSTLSLKELCALESAALTHPNRTVYFIMTNTKIERNEAMKNIEEKYKNTRIISIDLSHVFKGTILESIWFENKVQKSPHVYGHLADILRVWFLYNYGGTYLDADIIVLKSLPTNTNYGGAMFLSPFYVANGILHFEQGHPVMKIYLKSLASNYDNDNWDINGPVMLTESIQTFCQVTSFDEINKSPCSVNVLSPKQFLPIEYNDWKIIFDPKYKKKVNDALKESYILHYWGKLSSETDIKPGMPIYDIAFKKCPNTAKLII